MKFNALSPLPVKGPFRLDLTADALRRLASNSVDVVDGNGTYYRALADARGVSMVGVRQTQAGGIEVQATGRDARRWIPTIARMLGTQVDLTGWYARSAKIPWLRRLSVAFKGVKPPRYASAWEACAHAIVFQQISIHAASAIMRRAIEALSEPLTVGAIACRPFPGPERWLAANETALRAAGLSRNKVAHLHSVATAFAEGIVDDATIEATPTPEAAQALSRIRGLGPWSAAVVMLRGFGRLDTFPMRDSGVARAVAHLSGDAHLDLDAVLTTLGPTRGMLYYHLLLARLHPTLSP